ncbi:SDR family oxidoreductase [Actinoplanes sp. TBRC 11911]|uniref:SDR family NAD(P)-dependent oxidoreductase n=1 Tax=Actinoplanes sp. TBRC 11911 TaxID=2729386 RepID=UPI00145E7339|nr:SDR family oxidoreductase [Actinoplanes sp. TBRC 11911]NMO55964.1 SDR family oxidoreductase [Actinoplanes sp. TBRC 11911]
MISRAVLVTGSSRGLGAAIAQRFAGSGDRVAVHHRDSQKEAESVLSDLPGDGHILIKGDLSDPHAVREMVDLAARQLNGLDVLVNNAGAYGGRDRPHPVFGLDYAGWRDAWRETFEVNLFGAANATWAAAQHMRERGGRIINVSSRGAFRGEPEQPAYGASKAAMNAMGQSLAIALAPYGITVAGVAPGFIETDMVREHLEGPAGDAIRAQSPFGRIARPEEVAAAVHWLASAEAEWASGAILDLNGASYLRT